MLLKCSPLYLLSMLQLVVLSGIVAAYSNSYHQSPPPQTTTKSTTTSRNSLPGNDITVSTDVKSDVMLKPVSLSYLRDNLEKVSSLVDFVRLFTIPGTADHHINHLISRTIRSASYPKMNHPRHNGDNNADFSGVDENNGDNDVVNDDFMSFDTPNTVENGMGEDASNARDMASHYYDYEDEDKDEDEDPEGEPSADDLEAFEAALHNIEDMKTNPAYKCQNPTPFVHRVQEPHDDSQVFIPGCVILHRCMNHSGCCDNSDLVCAPKSMNIIVKSFMVVNRLSRHTDDVMYNARLAKTLSFVNHTECECRQRPRPPKCTQECPKLFHLTQELADCVCDCFSLAGADLWNCENVRDGLKPLPAGGLECIRSGNCYQPRCAEGEFDVTSGYCPLTDKYTLPSFMFPDPADRHHYREHLRDLNFTNLYSNSSTIIKDSIISPTPTSNSDGVSHTITDELKDVVHVLSEKASVHPTQTLTGISESSHASFTESSVTVSLAATDLPSPTETDVSSQKSEHEELSSVYPSCDDDMDDCDDCDDDFCGELSSSELSEGQSALDSTSQVKGIQTGPDDNTVSEVFSDATAVQTKDTNRGKTTPNLTSYYDLLLPNGYRQDVGLIKDNADDDDDDNDDDDDDDYIDKDDSSNNDYKDSSYTDYQADSSSTDNYKDSQDVSDYQADSSSTDYYKDSQDVSSKNYFKDLLSTDYHADSSFDPSRRDFHKDSSNKDHHKDSLGDDLHEDPSFEGHRRDSPSKDQIQEKRQSAPNKNLRHKFQTDSQFHETVHSSETTVEGQTDSKNINSEYSVFTPLSTVPSIASLDTSLPSTKLPKKSTSSQAWSSSSTLSSLSPQTASTPSRLSLLFSLTMNPEAQHLKTSTGTWLTNNQDPKISTEKSFLRRLYKHRVASTDGSGGDGG